MAEVLLRYDTVVESDEGRWNVRACGRERSDRMWEGWLEFVGDDGTVVRSGRETAQPNHDDVLYWATGLTPVYLEGALARALRPVVPRSPPPTDVPAFDGPAESEKVPRGGEWLGVDETLREAVLDPFDVYAKGEAHLRRELGALSAWHLANIARRFALAPRTLDVDALDQRALTEMIVDGVRARAMAQPASGPQR